MFRSSTHASTKGSELGSELTFLAGSELKTSELDTSELKTSKYRFLKIFILASYEQELLNILKLIDEGPFQIGTFRETLAEGNEGALHLGLPKDIYYLINHYTGAKDIWDNVKMLLEGSELTKEDLESQLFVTAVKLNRGLRDSNYDQLYAYLELGWVDRIKDTVTMHGVPHSKELHSAQATTELRILQRQDVTDAS
ncbi:hypothetical protein Tco_0335390 [Tanacetum coccineum]